MHWSDEIDLIPITYDENAMGDPIEVDGDPRTIYADKKSVRQSEFYQAAQTDLRPQIMFLVWTDEYQGEPKLTHDGTTYNIIRTYDRTDEKTELVCSGLVGD